MSNIKAIIERLRENEERGKKIHEVENRILSILNFIDFFEVLLTEIIEKFGVPYVWISLIESSEISNLIQSMEASEILKKRLNVIEKNIFLEIVANNTKPVLENNNLKPYFKLLPKESKYFIKSIAVAPITLDSEIIGSLNQADFSSVRFHPGMDTSLLEQLAIKVSLCLSNVTAHEKLKFLAYRDPLTELLNRRVMATALKREFARSKRYFSPLSVAFIDLDNFKQINDRYGHDCGDDVLKYVADTLTDSSRDSDIVARFAGDEFVTILPETSAKNAKNFMNRLKTYFMEHPMNMDGDLIRISISFGLASTEDKDIKNPAMLLKKADKRLLEAKKSGMNDKNLNVIQFLADGKK